MRFLTLLTICVLRVSAWLPPRGSLRFSPRCTRSMASTDAQVDELIAAVAPGADASYTTPERERISELVASLERKQANVTDLADPRLLGNWAVSCVIDGSGGTTSPVGGPFRGTRLGRAVFPTTGLYQNIVDGETIVNHLRFRLFGLIPGSVSLCGRFSRATEDDYAHARASWVRRRARAASRGGGDEAAEAHNETDESENDALLVSWKRELNSATTVAARFERPALALGRGRAACALGPELSRAIVLLDTSFLDERLRLGRNREGTRFVCVRTATRDAEGWRSPIARAPNAARDLLRWATVAALVAWFMPTAAGVAARLPRFGTSIAAVLHQRALLLSALFLFPLLRA